MGREQSKQTECCKLGDKSGKIIQERRNQQGRQEVLQITISILMNATIDICSLIDRSMLPTYTIETRDENVLLLRSSCCPSCLQSCLSNMSCPVSGAHRSWLSFSVLSVLCRFLWTNYSSCSGFSLLELPLISLFVFTWQYYCFTSLLQEKGVLSVQSC